MLGSSQEDNHFDRPSETHHHQQWTRSGRPEEFVEASFEFPALIPVTDQKEYMETAERLLDADASNRVLTSMPHEKAIKFLRGVEKAFCDFDGTIVSPGGIELTPSTIASIRAAHSVGVEVVGVTGKPWAEIEGLVQGLPRDFPLGIIFEKGAFILTRAEDGTPKREFFLATSEAVKATSEVKSRYANSWKAEIESQLSDRGTPVELVLAGTGTHEAVFSVDVLDPALLPADGQLDKLRDGRDTVKNHDETVITFVKDALTRRVQTVDGFQKSQAVDLGNSNIEVSPNNLDCSIEKNIAVLRYAQLDVTRDTQSERESYTMLAPTVQNTMAVLGDSGNDRLLLALTYNHSMFGGMLVFHKRTPRDLVEHAGFLTPGMAMGENFLKLMYQAKSGSL